LGSLYIPGVVIIPRLLGDAIETDTPRALLVGPYPLVLAALAQLVSGPPLNLTVEVATRTDDALNCLEGAGYDLVFCDLRSPPIPATELPARVRQRQLATRVVLLSDEEDAEQLVAALDCGAAGFFTKDASADEFVEGVQAVAAGHLAIGRNLARSALARLAGRQPATGGLDDRLSPAERSILALLGEAYSTRAIATARGISDKTVRNHMASIYRKLEVRNRSEAIMWSLRMRRAEIGAG
jgi:two-component system, NarL family, response regulator DegU